MTLSIGVRWSRPSSLLQNRRGDNGRGNLTPMLKSPIPALLRERASLAPNRTAFTFMNYEHDWAGIEESLTWAQLYRRALNLAHELRLYGSTGDRALILAPQGLDYVTAFLGAPFFAVVLRTSRASR